MPSSKRPVSWAALAFAAEVMRMPRNGSSIANAGAHRALSGIPTINETLAGFDVVVRFGLLAPAGTPPDIVAKLDDAVQRAVAAPKIQGVEETRRGAYRALLRFDVAI